MSPRVETASPHLPVRPQWLALQREDVLEPELPIIDAHHHLWDRPGGRYLLDELLLDLGAGHHVTGTVFVQCRTMYRQHGPQALRPVGEVEFIDGIAAQSASGRHGPARACAAIVGFADLMLGEQVVPVLHALEAAGNGRLRGIRNTTAWHADAAIRSNPLPPPPGMLLEPGFQAATRRLPAHGLTLDVWAYHTQLDEVLALARACPATTIVLDHLGGPLGAGPYRGCQAEVFRHWRDAMRKLAALPNVRLKLGGLGMPVGGWDFHVREVPPASEVLAAAW